MKAKKSYGQHFLHNEYFAEKISEIPSYTTGNALEIGPGKGALTKYLINKVDQFKVVEADQEMVDFLLSPDGLPLEKEQILQADFLKLDLNQVFNGESFTLIGNYPYNISSQIIIKMLENRELIRVSVKPD